MNISDKIKEQMKLKHTSNRAMAKKIDMSESGFYAALKNNTFKIDAIQKIADTLKINVDNLLDVNSSTETSKNGNSKSSTQTKTSKPKEFYQKRQQIGLLLSNKSESTPFLMSALLTLDIIDFIKQYIILYVSDPCDRVSNKMDAMINENISIKEIFDTLDPKFIDIIKGSNINLNALKKFNEHLIKFYKELAKNPPNENLTPLVETIELAHNV